MKAPDEIMRALPEPFPLEGHPAFSPHVTPSDNKDLVFLYVDLLSHLTLNEALLLSVIFHNKKGNYTEAYWQCKFYNWCSRSTFKRTVESLEARGLVSPFITEGNYSLTLKEDVLMKFCADAGLKRGKGKLLLAGKFIAINKTLINIYSLLGAIILEQIHRYHNYVLSSERDLNKSPYFLHGRPWFRRSICNMQEMDFSFLGLTSLKQQIKKISTSDPNKFVEYPLIQIKFGQCRNVSSWSINYRLLQKCAANKSYEANETVNLISQMFIESNDDQSKIRIVYLLAFCSRKVNEHHNMHVLYQKGLKGVSYFSGIVEVLVSEFSKSSQGNLNKFLITRYRKMGIRMLLMDLIRVVSSFYLKSGGRYTPIALETKLIGCSRYPKKDAEELSSFIEQLEGMSNLLEVYLYYLLEHVDKIKVVGHIRMAWRQYADDL